MDALLPDAAMKLQPHLERVGTVIQPLKMVISPLQDLYSLSGITRIMKARRMRWAGHVARIGENSNVYSLFVGKPEGS
jgi:hypothetical protein